MASTGRAASGHETTGLLNEPRRTRRGEATTPSVLSETYKISGTNDVQIVRFLLFLLLVSNRRCAREPIARGDGRGASGPNRPAQAKGRTGLLRYGCVTVLTATRVSRKLRTSRGAHAGAVRHRSDFVRGAPHCLRQWASKQCSPARRRDSTLGVAFLIWITRNPLKSPESDEGIQENPSPFSWSGLVWIWFGLEEFGLRRSADGVDRSRPARASPSEWAKLSRTGMAEFGVQAIERLESTPDSPTGGQGASSPTAPARSRCGDAD